MIIWKGDGQEEVKMRLTCFLQLGEWWKLLKDVSKNNRHVIQCEHPSQFTMSAVLTLPEYHTVHLIFVFGDES